jgi:hypothetical protein
MVNNRLIAGKSAGLLLSYCCSLRTLNRCGLLQFPRQCGILDQDTVRGVPPKTAELRIHPVNLIWAIPA